MAIGKWQHLQELFTKEILHYGNDAFKGDYGTLVPPFSCCSPGYVVHSLGLLHTHCLMFLLTQLQRHLGQLITNRMSNPLRQHKPLLS